MAEKPNGEGNANPGENADTGAPPPVEASEKAARQMDLEWDDSAMSTSYANVFNISMMRDEVGLFFGTNLTTGVGAANKVTIKLSDRIIMTPHSTKRLMLLLQANVKAYEDRHGALDVGTPG